jgi:hypothetical protein
MPTVADPKSDDDGPELLSGPSMGADGRLERFQRMEAPVPIVSSPRPDEPIELADVGPKKPEERIENFRDLPRTRAERSRSGALKVVIALLVLAVVAGVALVVIKPRLDLPTPDGVRDPTLLDQLNVGERSPIIISSVPTGAKVIIAGETVGETPWAADNRWVGRVKVRLQAPGYKPWDGEFDGDRPVTLDVKLKR